MATSEVADRSLAGQGQARIEWADAQMPVLRQIRERFTAERPLDGLVVAACLHVTAETANLVRTLMAGGARVALCSSNPLSTQDDSAAALAERYGAEVHAAHGEDTDAYVAHIRALVALEPQITLDDGADLLTVIHAREGAAARMLGGTEETASGLVRVRRMEAEGRLACPVIAVNEARTERVFNDRFGTGQSTMDGIMRATHLLLAGRTVVVLGYGWTGKGVALRARGAGAAVVVCEVDAVRALEARMEGFSVMPALEAAARGDVFITVTGARDVLTGEHFALMKDGAVLANAGHFDVEISVGELAALARERREVRPLVERFDLGDHALHLLAAGRVVNLAAAEGHPPEVMDMSFALQALAAEELVRHAGELGPGVHAVPDHMDQEVARLKLEALGVEIDTLTEQQERYLSSWGLGG
jgi:adenosylhomocysteinase